MARASTPIDHEVLLTLARKLQAAASDAEPWRMQRAAGEFAEALDLHLRDEAHAMGRVLPAQARILRKGQGRIRTLAAELLDDARRGCQASGAGCESRAGRLLALLSLQAADERRAWIRKVA
ncbi:MAG TPA: hypothetical protein VFN68_02540 [Acidimicrobiales bacterium]|nr:hypothetical protein [Acidimicrobiales bacterium]